MSTETKEKLNAKVEVDFQHAAALWDLLGPQFEKFALDKGWSVGQALSHLIFIVEMEKRRFGINNSRILEIHEGGSPDATA